MAIFPICHFPENSVLRQKAKRVTNIDGSIRRLIDDMVETMHQANGVGLAAPQVGISLRVIVLQMLDKEPIPIVNQDIVKRAGGQDVSEACLSVPGHFGEVKRSASVIVKGQSRDGKAIRIKAMGLMAKALEHETDQLNGTLYINHMESQDKLHKIER